ncbi:hypothetical protein [Texcoconibacillus texcoconensis]|uniref:Flagellar hook-length control protein-like C-terminal domain-containing protein n=1 Tax=Texcoconibacillus texcoconensis TaxID=1095777 RepID=A0A840QL55_9BACI|nr:hypothetical protein [Texcoconibacillus texcoconensis]MBB5172095.1 hypothetical protein [Texcoconibacillus texcoconensis]
MNVIGQQLSGVQLGQTKSSVQLRPGQMFQGQIHKLYPGNLARLSIGDVALTARLEASLEQGMRYWFRVQGSSDSLPRLKVLENVNALTERGSAEDRSHQDSLLRQIGLQDTKANRMLIQQFTQTNLPFSKQNIQDAGQILQQTNMVNQSGVELMQTMLERRLPITETTFQSLQAWHATEPLGETMLKLQQTLSQEGNKYAILQQLNGQLLQMLSQAQMGRNEHPLMNILQMVGNESMNDRSVATGAEQILRQLGLFPQDQPITQVYEQFKSAVLNEQNRQIVNQLWPHLASNQGVPLANMEASTVFTTLMSTIRPEALADRQMFNQFVQLLGGSATQEQALQQFQQMIQSPTSLTSEMRGAIEEWQQTTRANIGSPTHSNPNFPFQSLLQQLGMSFEYDLQNQAQQGRVSQSFDATQQLKPLLMQTLQLPLSSQMLEQAEFLLQRLTGQQLLASEQNGPLQQIISQWPVKYSDSYQDITVQWESKRTPDGKIDSNHCRILFYLYLEKLDETVIDVQIQNRIVALQIFNEEDKPTDLIEALKPHLQQQLASLDYRLSTVKWVQPKEKSQVAQPSNHHEMRIDERSYQGLDVRV